MTTRQFDELTGFLGGFDYTSQRNEAFRLALPHKAADHNIPIVLSVRLRRFHWH